MLDQDTKTYLDGKFDPLYNDVAEIKQDVREIKEVQSSHATSIALNKRDIGEIRGWGNRIWAAVVAAFGALVLWAWTSITKD